MSVSDVQICVFGVHRSELKSVPVYYHAELFTISQDSAFNTHNFQDFEC